MKEVTFDFADNPVLNCYIATRSGENWTLGSVSKTEPSASLNESNHDSLIENSIELYAYPNPSEDGFSFEIIGIEDNATIDIQIVDITGSIVHESNLRANNSALNNIHWDARGYTQGYYIYHVIIGGKKHFIGKLIKL